MGPCEIRKHVQSSRYTVLTPYGIEDHCADQMKKYRPELQEQRIPFSYYKPSLIPEDGTWTVEKIMKHRTVNGRTDWLVQWRGYDRPSWESAEQFLGSTQEDWLQYNREKGISIAF